MHPDAEPSRSRLSTKLIIAAVAALVVLIVGIPWLYTNVLNDDQPEKLALSAPTSSAAPSGSAAATSASAAATSAAGSTESPVESPAETPSETSTATSEAATSEAATSAAASATGAAVGGDSLNGEWTIGTGSVVGYRVKEVLLGQDTEGVGRTSDVTGDITVAGDAVTAAKFTADLTTVKSDKDRRDGQFQGRIMDTATHPTATFVSTAPIPVPGEAIDSKPFTAKAAGDLTLRGTTKPVTFDVSGQKVAEGFEVTAQIPIVFADFGIPDPSFGPAKVGKDGILEVLLKLVPKS